MNDTSNVTQLHPIDELPLIPPGEYELALVQWETLTLPQFRQSPKLKLIFRVLDMGPHFGVHLERWYNVARHIGKRGRSGGFKVGARSDAYREFCSLITAPMRPDRVPLGNLKREIVIGRVRTVTKDRKQRDIPEAAQYSVIDELLRVKR